MSRVTAARIETVPEIDSRSHDDVTCLYQDREGSMWAGTGDGLIRVREGRFRLYTTREGLAHNKAAGMIEGRDGTVWVFSDGGGTPLRSTPLWTHKLLFCYTLSIGLAGAANPRWFQTEAFLRVPPHVWATCLESAIKIIVLNYQESGQMRVTERINQTGPPSLSYPREVWEQIFGRPTNNLFIQLFRYTFVGGLAFVVDFGSLFLLTEFFGVHYLISAAIAFLLGIATNYSLSIAWVFNKRTRNKWVEIAIFVLIGGIGLGWNELIIWVLTEHIEFHYLVSKLFATGIVFMWNFFVRKFVLFH